MTEDTDDTIKSTQNDVKLEEKFEVVPQSLEAILREEPAVRPSEVGVSVHRDPQNRPRIIPGEFRIPHSLGRVSFYSRRPRVRC